MTGNRPAVRPARPFFSSGPCAKRPGWSLEALEDAGDDAHPRAIVPSLEGLAQELRTDNVDPADDAEQRGKRPNEKRRSLSHQAGFLWPEMRVKTGTNLSTIVIKLVHKPKFLPIYN